MAVPFIFATMPGGNVPASDLDTNFAALVQGQGAGFTLTRNQAYGVDTALAVINTFYQVVSLNVGTAGIWLVWGYCSVFDSAGAANFQGSLDDGTTNFATATISTPAASSAGQMVFSALVTSPVAALQIRVRDITSASGNALSNVGGFGNKGIGLAALRVG